MNEDIWDFNVDADAINRASESASRYGNRLRGLAHDMEFLLGLQRKMRAAMSQEINPDAPHRETVDFGSKSRGFQMLVPTLGVEHSDSVNPFSSIRHTIERMRAVNLQRDELARAMAKNEFFTDRARSEQKWEMILHAPSGLAIVRGSMNKYSDLLKAALVPSAGQDAVDADYTMKDQSGAKKGYEWNGWGQFFEDLAGGPNSRRMRQANLWTSAGEAVGGFGGRIMRGIGSFMRLSAGLSALVIPVIALGYAFKKLIGVCQQFYAVAAENFRLFKMSATMNMLGSGGSANALDAQIKAMRILGGDAASVSTLNAKLSSARAMIGYGGNGGAFMEAARLFGVSIHGSGKYGLATNDEMLRHIARRMGQLDPESQIALANTMGLSPEMFWAMKDGLSNYQNRMFNASTFLDRYSNEGVLDRDGIFGSTSGAFMGALSEDFVATWGEFVNSMKELGLVLGKALLPALGAILKIVNAIIQAVSYILNLIDSPLGWIFRKVAQGLDVAFDKRPTDIPSESEMDWQLRGAESDVSEYDNTRIVNINQVTVETNDALTNDNASSFGRSVGSGAMESISVQTLSGTP